MSCAATTRPRISLRAKSGAATADRDEPAKTAAGVRSCSATTGRPSWAAVSLTTALLQPGGGVKVASEQRPPFAT